MLRVIDETIGDEAEPEEVDVTERHLLDVASTPASGGLLITGGLTRSEFLDDLG